MTDQTENDDYPICEDECVTWGGHADNCRVPAAIRALEAKVRVEARRGDRWQNAHEEQRKALERTHHMLRNLLARIHRDGGHYAKQHGLEKAAEDADQIVADLFADRDRLAGEVDDLLERIDTMAIRYGGAVARDERLTAEVARLTSELAAARENEARYLWLRDEATWHDRRSMLNDTGPNIDAAIDAARRAGGEG